MPVRICPIDHIRITEVTEIHFASDELVAVAAQCLADLAEKESINAGQAPHEPENEPEGATETPSVQTDEDMMSKGVGEQCATAHRVQHNRPPQLQHQLQMAQHLLESLKMLTQVEGELNSKIALL